MSDSAPNRRWFRFSLRTMFVVVTVFACYFAWQFSYIQKRKAFLIYVEEVNKNGPPTVNNSTRTASIPLWRRLLGDHAIPVISLPMELPDEDYDKAKSLFPEAEILGVPKPLPGPGR